MLQPAGYQIGGGCLTPLPLRDASCDPRGRNGSSLAESVFQGGESSPPVVFKPMSFLLLPSLCSSFCIFLYRFEVDFRVLTRCVCETSYSLGKN